MRASPKRDRIRARTRVFGERACGHGFSASIVYNCLRGAWNAHTDHPGTAVLLRLLGNDGRDDVALARETGEMQCGSRSAKNGITQSDGNSDIAAAGVGCLIHGRGATVRSTCLPTVPTFHTKAQLHRCSAARTRFLVVSAAGER